MNRFTLLTTTLFLTLSSFLFAQTDNELFTFIKSSSKQEQFNQMNAFMVDRQYKGAIYIIDHFIKTEGENANYNYRKGLCLLYSKAHDNTTSLEFLKKAEGNINPKYNGVSMKEEGASDDVIYFLAKSYFINENLSKAKEYYEKFIPTRKKKNAMRVTAVHELKQVENAIRLMNRPKDFTIDNLGRQVNSKYPDYAPVITLDGQALYFTSRRLRKDSLNDGVVDPETDQYFEDIYVSYIDRRREWSEPVLLDFCEPSRHEATVSVAPDESKVYVYQDDEGDGNIYSSSFDGERFTEIEKLKGQVNSPAWETHITYTPDGNEAFFVSDREGGMGGRDIWRIKKLPNGNWSEPYNLGAPINTIYDEDAPFIGVDHKTLYFSSNSDQSMGGFDVFRSIADEDGVWSAPINLGFPLNTVADDIFFTTTADGHTGFLSSNRIDGHGEKDIYRVYDLEPEMMGVSTLKGLISTTDGSALPDDFTIKIACKNCDFYPVRVVKPRQINGGYFEKIESCRDFKVGFYKGDKLLKEEIIQTECNDEFQLFKRDFVYDPEKNEFVKPEPEIVDNGNSEPSEYSFPKTELKHYFTYNSYKLDQKNSRLQDFISKIKTGVDKGASITIKVESSASKVTTKTFGTNDKLAKKRAQDIKQLVLDMLRAQKVDVSKVNIKIIKTLVQGPAYKSGNGVKRSEYEKYQYIFLKAE